MIAIRTAENLTSAIGNSLLPPNGYNELTYSRNGMRNRLDQQVVRETDRNNVVRLNQKSPSRQAFEYFALDLSSVSMHFTNKMRASLTAQVKSMLSDENWEVDDVTPSRAAFITLFRVLSTVKAVRPPSIGANGTGSVTASWFVGQDRLTLDCLDRDRIVFVLTRKALDGETEKAAGETRAPLLLEKLRPYKPEVWFS